jgi:nicotinamide mononucleotide transporter
MNWFTWSNWEIAANVAATASVVLAARNNVHLWWTGIVGSVLFCRVFYDYQLYADATLQVFFIGTSIIGWRAWLHKSHSDKAAIDTELPIARTPARQMIVMMAAAIPAVVIYGALLFRYTDAYAPFIDAFVLGSSVVATYLLMYRRVETWPGWLIVNTVSVPLYLSRGLTLTAIVYAVYWFNAWNGWRTWNNEIRSNLSPS